MSTKDKEKKRPDQQGTGSSSKSPGVLPSMGNSGNYLQNSLDYGAADYRAREERTLQDYPFIILRYWTLILALTLIGIGVAKYRTDRMPRLYRATTLINIGRYVPPVDGPTGAILKEQTRSRNYTNTQIRLLKSYTLAEQVVSRNPDILEFLDARYAKQRAEMINANGANLNESQKTPVQILQRYLSMISFWPLPETTLVEIHATSVDPEMTARVANAHAEAFVELVQERRRKSANVNLNFLKEKYEEATKKLEDAEKKRLEHSKRNPISVAGNDVVERTISRKYEGLVASLNSVIFEKVNLESNYRELRRSGGVGSTDEGGLSEGKITILELENEYRNLRKKLRNKRDYRLTLLQEEITSAKSILKMQGKERIKAARKAYRAAVEKETFLRNEFEKLHAEQLALAQHKVEQGRLRQIVASAKEIHKTLAQRLEDAMVNIQTNQETVSFVDKAFTPLGHFSPNESSNLWTGCLLGLLLGIFMAFLLDYLDNTVRSAPDLPKAMQAQVLGVIPEFSKKIKKLSAAALDKKVPLGYGADEDINVEETTIIIDDKSMILPISAPFSPESEAFRGILATLTSGNVEDIPKCILVTSGQKRDGKTTLAINLAATLAQMSERTLLIDGDLRLPSAWEYFSLPRNFPGVTECLTEGNDPREFIINAGMENLWLLSAGKAVENSAALIRSEQMSDMLADLRNEFDYVIIDSSPLGPVADALLLSKHVDGVALVVRSGETSKMVAESSVGRLRQVGANILGVVLNDSNKYGGGYFRSGSRYSGYRYGYGKNKRDYTYYR